MDSIEKHVITWLLNEQEEKYRTFSASLLPNIDNVLGVRLPKLRKFAKTLLNADYERFLDHAGQYLEETMLQGMLIGLIKEPPEIKLIRIKKFLPKIDNWSVCDSFCCGLKFAKENKQIVWKFIFPLIRSKNEYDIRFAIVMMLDYFIEENYIDKVLTSALTVNHSGYYAKMSVAWLLSMCYVKFPQKTYECIEKLHDNETKKRTIRKICESYQISKEEKFRLKNKFL